MSGEACQSWVAFVNCKNLLEIQARPRWLSFPDAVSGKDLVDNIAVGASNPHLRARGPQRRRLKKGGWQAMTAYPGPFKNQGQCVSWFNRNK